MAKVSLIRCENYDDIKIKEAVETAIGLVGGIENYILPGQKVLVKPNMLTSAKPEEAVCTHPSVVKAILNLIISAQGKPIVGDSPAIGSANKVAEKNGIAAVCKELSVPIIDFDRPKEVTFPRGEVCKRFVIDEAVLEADLIINIPKLKTHGLTYLTGGVKNLYGCITGKQKAQFHLRMPQHDDFSNMLIDLYSLLRPSLTIMDGIYGMEGAGPRNGKPRKIGVILASASAVALDAVATTIIGLNPLDIPTTKLAIKRKVDLVSIEVLEVVGDPVKDFIITDFKQSKAFSTIRSIPKPLLSFVQNQLTAKPVISDKCIGCGVCKDSCPPEIIQIKNKKAIIAYDKCIRCYCCQELCPHDAIDLKRGKFSRFIFD